MYYLCIFIACFNLITDCYVTRKWRDATKQLGYAQGNAKKTQTIACSVVYFRYLSLPSVRSRRWVTDNIVLEIYKYIELIYN